MAAIRRYAADLLAGGYPREELHAELDRARDLPERRKAPEDPILDVLDFVVGWCSAASNTLMDLAENGCSVTATRPVG